MERVEDEMGVPRSLNSTARVLYVVARDRPDVYTALRESFVESPRLGIVLDRRGSAPPVATMLAAERRRLLIDEALRTRGWALVRIERGGQAILVDEDMGGPRRAPQTPHAPRAG
jgi:hypothetical protein